MIDKIQKVKPMGMGYPCLKINAFGAVVLFTSSKSGIVVQRPRGYTYFVGHFRTDWFEDQFVNFKDQVILKNGRCDRE